MMINEMYLKAELAERERWGAQHVWGRAAQFARLPAARPSAGALPQGARMQRLLAELYGSTHTPEHDPQLLSRLAWSGIDEQ